MEYAYDDHGYDRIYEDDSNSDYDGSEDEDDKYQQSKNRKRNVLSKKFHEKRREPSKKRKQLYKTNMKQNYSPLKYI